MDDIDDLFTEQLNDGLTEQLDGDLTDGLNAELDRQLEGPLAEVINGQLDLNPVVEVLPQPPPPADLLGRLDELHAGGCNQSLAWSRLGALACISADRKSVSIKCLQFHQDGNWKLSEYTDPSLMDKLGGFYRGFDFVHVAWGPVGSELLIIDSCGRIAVGYVYVTLNRISIQKALNHDPEDNLNTVIAIKWLNQVRKPAPLPGPAKRENGRWSYPLSPCEARGPFSPNTKAGFLIITRGGMLKLYLSGTTPSDWMEVKYELDGISSSHETITHAAMTAEKNVSKKDDEVLLAVHTTAKRLRLYTVRIDWQATQDSFGASPSFYVQHVSQIQHCVPRSDQTLLDQAGGLIQEEAELCFLTLIPRESGLGGSSTAMPPVVLATFSQTSISGAATSIISRWELNGSNAVVDSTFSQLSTKKASQGRLPDAYILKALEDIHLDRLIINIDITTHDVMLAFCYATGEVDFKDRNMGLLEYEPGRDTATSLARMGFSFDIHEPCLQTVLAPHFTVKVSINKAHDFTLSSMRFVLPPTELLTLQQDPHLMLQFVAALVVQHAASEGTGSAPTDDLVMTMWIFEQQLPEDSRRTMETQFMKDLYQVLQITSKCADANVEGYIKFTALGRAASMQASLGVRTYNNHKLEWTRTGKIAFTLQSLRIIALSLSFSVATISKGQEMDLQRPETLEYITPQVKWFITLIDYIMDQLFQVNRVIGTKSFDGRVCAQKCVSSYACLVLVMCTITRNYIRYIIRAIKTLPKLLQSMSHMQGAGLSAALRSGVIAPNQFEAILEMTDQILNTVYSQIKPGQRQEIEMDLLAEGKIPTILDPIIHKLLSQPIEQTRTKLGEMEEKLAFRQWGPVSLAEDRQTKQWDSETVWDGSRKVDMTGKSARTRTCLRCTGLMEEPGPGKERAYRGWLTNLTRTCFCGGHWVLDPVPVAA